MAGCCDPSGYRGVFDRKAAERSARAFARKGLDSTAEPMVGALRERGIEGATVLEVGAGAGTAIVSMLDAGASGATGVELSPNYEETARSLLEERGVAQDVDWRTGDAVTMTEELGTSDVVFLNRVVCCYPYADDLVDAAASSSRQLLAISYPRDRFLVRLGMRIINGWLWLVRNSFRVFLHDPDDLEARIRRAGFERVAGGTTPAWHWGVWERSDSA